MFAFDCEPDECAYGLPALQTCCSGVDVEKVECGVVLDFEYVGVSGYEEVGGALGELLPEAGGVLAGVASDVGHEDFGLFASPCEFFGVEASDVGTVDVAVYGSQGLDVVEEIQKVATNASDRPNDDISVNMELI